MEIATLEEPVLVDCNKYLIKEFLARPHSFDALEIDKTSKVAVRCMEEVQRRER